MLDAPAAYPYRRFGQQKPAASFSSALGWLAGAERELLVAATRRLLQGSTPAALSVAGASVLQTSGFGGHGDGKINASGSWYAGRQRPPRIGRRECAAMRQRQQRRPVLFGSRSNADLREGSRGTGGLPSRREARRRRRDRPPHQARDRSTVLPAWRRATPTGPLATAAPFANRSVSWHVGARWRPRVFFGQMKGSASAVSRRSTASARELTPRRRRAFLTCVRTVCGESTSSSATWSVRSPSP